MKKFLHYINILFNVSTHEWPRIILSWLLKITVHAGFVMGSTVLLALFVEEYGITRLPYMYIISAVFVVIGSIIFSFFLERFEKVHEILIITLFSSVLFISAPFVYQYSVLFYAFIFTAISIFISQMNIILALFIEELFSPLESERTFPIIESSEPIGGIIAGALLTISVTQMNLSAVKILYYIGGIIFLVVPILLIFFKWINKIPNLEIHEEDEEKNRFEKAKKGLRHIKGMPFLKGLLIVVLLHFTFVNLVEYQYTSVINASISEEGNSHTNKVQTVKSTSYDNKSQGHLDMNESSHGETNTNESSHGANINTNESSTNVGHSRANALTHGLAFWHVMFSLIAFLVQVIGASRIQSFFGIINNMKIHPLINIISGVFLLFRFGYVSGITSKGIFEVTAMMHRTTYHASFYVLKKSIREQVKEFMEGIIRPIGMIFGTVLLSIIVNLISDKYQHDIISAMMIIIMIVIYFTLVNMKGQYTLIAKKNLTSRNTNAEKIEAIEILAQKGHDNVSDILGKNLDRHHVNVQRKVLETIGSITDINSIPDILNAFESKEKNVRFAAVQALTKYKRLGEHFFSQSFAKHRVIHALEQLFITERSKKIKSAVVQVFKNIKNADIIPFLLNVLKSEDEELIIDAIYVCGLFNDVNSSYYIEKYLQSSNPKIKSMAIISLWNFPKYRLQCLIQLTQMLESKDVNMKISGIYVLGEIKAVQEIPRLEKLLKHENEHIQCHALIALAKMNKSYVAHDILKFLLHKEKDLNKIARKLIQGVYGNTRKTIENVLLHEVSREIHKIFLDSKSSGIHNFSEEQLNNLKDYYELINQVKEVLIIEEELERRNIEKEKKNKEL